MQNNNRASLSTSSLLGLATAGVVMGAAALYFSQPVEEKVKANKGAKAKVDVIEQERISQLLKKQSNVRRRVNLYFDENDEMVEKEESDEEHPPLIQDQPFDAHLHKKLIKLKQHQIINSRTKITVNIGDADYDNGKVKITKDIFDGRDKAENAEMFIENLIKTRRLKDGDSQSMCSKLAEMEEESRSLSKDKKRLKQTPVIMDLNPNKYTKDKDKIFMDFFSLYGKNFIDQHKSKGDASQRRENELKSGANTTGNMTPLSHKLQ